MATLKKELADSMKARLEGRREALEQQHIKARHNVVTVLNQISGLRDTLPGVGEEQCRAAVVRQAYANSMRIVSQQFFGIEPDALLESDNEGVNQDTEETKTEPLAGVRALANVLGAFSSGYSTPHWLQCMSQKEDVEKLVAAMSNAGLTKEATDAVTELAKVMGVCTIKPALWWLFRLTSHLIKELRWIQAMPDRCSR